MIFTGYYIWNNHMATPMQSFPNCYAKTSAGKKIALFATNGGSGISISVNDTRNLLPDATLTKSLHFTMTEQLSSKV